MANAPDQLLRRSDENRVEMLCPKCESWQDILCYKNLGTIRKYGKSLNPIVKCVVCKHLFSPRWAANDD